MAAQLVGLAIERLERVLVFSGEMRRQTFTDWMLASRIPCRWDSIPDPRPADFLDLVGSDRLAFLRASGTVTSAEIARAVELLNPSLAVLDNMAKLRHADRFENRQVEVQAVMNDLQHLAAKLPIVVAAHLNRNPMSRAGGAVSMLDTRESASIENLSDVYIALQPDAAQLERVQEDNLERLSVTAKVMKNRLNGILGAHRLELIRHERRFVRGGKGW
jgi:hypothetical protein